jgi:hypothetical protein
MADHFPEETRPFGPLCLRDSRISCYPFAPSAIPRAGYSPERLHIIYSVGNNCHPIVVDEEYASSSGAMHFLECVAPNEHINGWKFGGSVLFFYSQVADCPTIDYLLRFPPFEINPRRFPCDPC